jgi:two-component system sensor histidine kinase GlrK
MRLSYPRSFLSLLLIGFTIVAAPLVFALFANAVAFEKLAALSEQAVLAAVKVTQASRALTTNVASLERTARQYAVAGEAPFLDAYRANRAAFASTLRSLEEMPLSDAQRAESAAIAKM